MWPARFPALKSNTEEGKADVSDIRRRVIDLEADTVTRAEFNEFKSKTSLRNDAPECEVGCVIY